MIIERLNADNNSLPSMNMESFIDFLTQMSYDVENILSKKPVDIVGDFVAYGCNKIRNQPNQCKGISLPVVSFPECPTILFIFETEWQIVTPALFSQLLRRFHVCIMTQCEKWREKNVGPPRPLNAVMSNMPAPERDARAIAKDHKISSKIYSLNLSSARFISRTKSLICATTIIK